MTDEQFQKNKQQFLEALTTLSRLWGIYIHSGESACCEPYLATDCDPKGKYTVRGNVVGFNWRTEDEEKQLNADPRTPEQIALENDFDSFTGGSNATKTNTSGNNSF